MNGGRKASASRKTKETVIEVELELESAKDAQVETGIGFFDHMLCAFAKNAGVGLKVRAVGDLKTGAHHTIEDVGICIGEAVAAALDEKRGISRYGFFVLPMDDALASAAVDFGGRAYCKVDAKFAAKMIGGFEIEAVPEFFAGFAQGARANVNVKCLEGENDHHKIEAMFKAFGRAVRQAVAVDSGMAGSIPSTKGVI
jgi:imidazoleglycerol phosphate dehydratase HisB